MAAVNIIKGKTITIVIMILHRRHVEIERSGIMLVEVERSGVVVIFSVGLVQIEPSPQISHAKLKIWLSTTQTKWHEE